MSKTGAGNDWKAPKLALLTQFVLLAGLLAFGNQGVMRGANAIDL